MGLFNFGKKDKIIDWSEKYKEQERFSNNNSKKLKNDEDSVLDLSNNSQENTEQTGSIEERRQKLAKRFVEMETRLENLSNQIYHLQQRVEVLEKKSGTRFESN